jgi:hypothetical protein
MEIATLRQRQRECATEAVAGMPKESVVGESVVRESVPMHRQNLQKPRLSGKDNENVPLKQSLACPKRATLEREQLVKGRPAQQLPMTSLRAINKTALLAFHTAPTHNTMLSQQRLHSHGHARS